MKVSQKSEFEVEILTSTDEVIARVLGHANMQADFKQLIKALSKFFDGQNRILIMYRDGIIEETRADMSCQLFLVEEDRYDEPPISIRVRTLIGDSNKVNEALDIIKNHAGFDLLESKKT